MSGYDFLWHLLISLLCMIGVYGIVRYGAEVGWRTLHQLEARLDRTLNQHLLMDIHPRVALASVGLVVVVCGMFAWLVSGSLMWSVVGMALGLIIPPIILRHLERKRRLRLEMQLVDGIMTLASGVRAGLTLVQAMELLVANGVGPIKQEFAQLLREYQMGLDLHQAMRNTSNRVGSSHFRLLFTALEMHRQRGGDSAQSLDRIADSIREIQRLEGKLDALTAQGRSQARMMAGMAVVVLGVYYMIDPEGVTKLFMEPLGRVLLLAAGLMIVIGFLWIKRIMSVDV